MTSRFVYDKVLLQGSSTNFLFTNNLLPATCNVSDIGSSNLQWKDVYAAGEITVGNGIINNALLMNAPKIRFDGSATVRDNFLNWMQFVTSDKYRSGYDEADSWWSDWEGGRTPVEYVYSTVSGYTRPTTDAYLGGVLLPDGRVVFVPYNAAFTTIYNPATNSYATLGPAPGNFAYIGGVLLPDGRVVFVPRNAAFTTIYNPATNSYATLGPAPGNNAYLGGVLLPDGRVVFVPLNAAFTTIYNPATNSYATLGPAPGNFAYAGGVLLPDGRVVFVPDSAAFTTIYNPNTNSYSTLPGAPGGGAYYGGTLLPDGRVVFIPRNALQIGVLTPTNLYTKPPPKDLCYHPCFNKL